ncbi:replication-associated protein [Crucivirus-124]|nr:replication-associated protein [Crucivirus-124]
MTETKTETNVEQKGFRFQNTAALLTYSTHINKKEYIEWFKTLSKQTPTFIRLAHETGSNENKEEKYEHTHVVFKVSKRIDTINQRFFDYNNIHPHIKILKGNKAIDDAKQYIAKEDPENKDLLIEPSIVHGIWAETSIQDALSKFVQKPSDAMGIVSIYNYKKNEVFIDEEDEPNFTWHKEIMEEFKERARYARKRHVTWIYETVGLCQKTDLTRYLMLTQPNAWFSCKDLGNAKDAATIIANAIAGGWTGHGCIIDLPRSASNHKRIYNYIEEIKDGMVTSQKYSGRTFVFNKPHVLVLANWAPKLFMDGKPTLSFDKWSIRQLTKKTIDGKLDVFQEKIDIFTDKRFLNNTRSKKLIEDFNNESTYNTNIYGTDDTDITDFVDELSESDNKSNDNIDYLLGIKQ